MKKATEYQNRWRRKRIEEGWKFIATMLPPDVYEKMTAYQRKLMVEYHNKLKSSASTEPTELKPYEPTQ